jgi:hypothetical protein
MELVLIRMKNPGPFFLTRSFIGKKYEGEDALELELEECTQYSTTLQSDGHGKATLTTQYMTNDEITEGRLSFQPSEVEFWKDVLADHELRKVYVATLAQYRAQKSGLIIPPGQRPPTKASESAQPLNGRGIQPGPDMAN